MICSFAMDSDETVMDDGSLVMYSVVTDSPIPEKNYRDELVR